MNYVQQIRSLIGHRLLLLVGANVIITDPHQRLLLQLRRDGTWGLPGGLLEPGESLEETATREVKEETNLEVRNLALLGVFSGPEYTFTLQNKDEINVITSLYWAREWSGDIINDPAEGHELAFFAPQALPGNMDEEYRVYIRHYLEWVR
ncbi:UNVERIFIED_ORG: ADP-ribose pyrophosphatase YjhB (NUDIX family) [Kosakonia oryzae]|uniref:ADP-ribose pyrophosphatase YjhB, NUDIX family n=1 Tax=Kosakonia radicincitans TaxID=283686 RepID=A0AAX2EW61_9ENTR|nr:NUDIX domain-containing protein [Kosakonia radicincitans]MDP9568874.1 ADP-ribose pyrophosphatase YjhB (NUDIX family) [Kosakonia oryzae]SFF14166.1 ADP-ribose pyrophosphatase YjhB, NUDIX family [Kosakonia radicincitans]SFR21875.1 ADP-ribose pyrophosphatase YjhB, NUDIX family [Kosakonia radicincitans]SFT98202.1 ADP-ribose pyrophosphatase YjhB, NUDIX family [Kosakonia radicincitans]SFY13047.1 ADP-ribose pyrophosphatase YjhB, NUDIX family [Kosakonia radicincitans]